MNCSQLEHYSWLGLLARWMGQSETDTERSVREGSVKVSAFENEDERTRLGAPTNGQFIDGSSGSGRPQSTSGFAWAPAEPTTGATWEGLSRTASGSTRQGRHWPTGSLASHAKAGAPQQGHFEGHFPQTAISGSDQPPGGLARFQTPPPPPEGAGPAHFRRGCGPAVGAALGRAAAR